MHTVRYSHIDYVRPIAQAPHLNPRSLSSTSHLTVSEVWIHLTNRLNRWRVTVSPYVCNIEAIFRNHFYPP